MGTGNKKRGFLSPVSVKNGHREHLKFNNTIMFCGLKFVIADNVMKYRLINLLTICAIAFIAVSCRHKQQTLLAAAPMQQIEGAASGEADTIIVYDLLGDMVNCERRVYKVDPETEEWIEIPENEGPVYPSMHDDSFESAPEDEDTIDYIPYPLVETKPMFMGEIPYNKFNEWVYSKRKYPAAARVNGEQGRVILSFVVNEDGSVSDVTVERGVSPLLDAEAIRVVSGSPKWTPGKQRDKVVPVKIYYPVIFSLNEGKGH